MVDPFEVRESLIMKKAAFLFFWICYVTSSHCFGAIDPNHAVSNTSAADSNNIKTTVAGNTDFALTLYGKLKDDQNATAPKGNLFFSPYSISTALAMTYGGARGETQKQMADTSNMKMFCFMIGMNMTRCGMSTLTNSMLPRELSMAQTA
jgi:serine protease inhibitor